jgi:hypothetical protein
LDSYTTSAVRDLSCVAIGISYEVQHLDAVITSQDNLLLWVANACITLKWLLGQLSGLDVCSNKVEAHNGCGFF